MNRGIARTHLGERFLRRNAAIHDPDPPARAKACFDGRHDGFHGLHIARVAGQRVMSQREAFARHDQSQDDLFAVPTMVARIAALGQRVFLRQALEVTAGEIIQQHVIVQLEQRS